MSDQTTRIGKDVETAASGPFLLGSQEIVIGTCRAIWTSLNCPTVLSALKTTLARLEAARKNVAFVVRPRIEPTVGTHRLLSKSL